MRIKSLLGRLYPQAPPADPVVRDALQARLMRSFPASGGATRRRWLVGLTLAGAAGLGACVVPTNYALAVGHRFVVTMQAPPSDFDPEAVQAYVEAEFAQDDLRVMVRRAKRDDGPEMLHMAIDLVGNADPDEVEASMLAQFPALQAADIDVEALDGVVHGTFGGLLSERALGLHLDRGSVQETRARILADLAARGIDGNVTVEIEDEDTPSGRRREVRVRVQADSEAAP